MDELIESFLPHCSRGKAVEIRMREFMSYKSSLLAHLPQQERDIQEATYVHDPSLGCRIVLHSSEPQAFCLSCIKFWSNAERRKNTTTIDTVKGVMDSDQWAEMIEKSSIGKPYKYFCGPEFHFKRVSEVLHGK